jgi:exopolysaccharide biosynthesis protein
MEKRRKKTRLFSVIYPIIAVLYMGYVLADCFLIPKTYTSVSGTSSSQTATTSTVSSTSSDATVTDTSYNDGNIKITITTKRVDGTTVYIADVQLSSIDYLQTAFADGTYGRNIKETTSDIAQSVNAILAINGDYYGFRDSGYVIRNGTLYRSTKNTDSEYDDLVIYKNGTFASISEDDYTAQELIDAGALDVFSFGPTLVENSKVSVSENEEVDQSMTSNPRTAIGIINSLHYVFVVSDGRTSESEGLTLYELAGVMKDLGCTVAYNLDGGGSSTMYFNGEVVNKPTTNGNTISERKVSDIVCIIG